MSGVFKAYDIRGIYSKEINEELAEKIGRAFCGVFGLQRSCGSDETHARLRMIYSKH